MTFSPHVYNKRHCAVIYGRYCFVFLLYSAAPTLLPINCMWSLFPVANADVVVGNIRHSSYLTSVAKPVRGLRAIGPYKCDSALSLFMLSFA